MRDTSKMTAYQTLCYLASQERADEIAEYARQQVRADEKAQEQVLFGSITIAALGCAVVFIAAIFN